MMVGSIKTTVNEGDFVKRGQEFGYFAFGECLEWCRRPSSNMTTVDAITVLTLTDD